jgi:uncharacterized BrkB/YihY/UPF0761 family membrane protein
MKFLAQTSSLDTSVFAAYIHDIFFNYAIPISIGGAILMFAIGGLMIIYSGGEASRVQAGKDIITGTVIGLVLMLLAAIILAAIDPDLGNLLKP